MSRTLTIIVLLIGIAGCSTAAQRQAAYIHDGINETTRKWSECFGSVQAKPAAQRLKEHPGVEVAVALYIEAYNDLAPCRENLVEGVTQYEPGLVPPVLDLFRKLDSIDLIEKRITPNAYVARGKAALSDFVSAAKARGKKLGEELRVAHNAEISQRGDQWRDALLVVAVGALNAWTSEQQVLARRWPSRVVTRCFSVGRMVRCSSRWR
jgi:hypothetical protein